MEETVLQTDANNKGSQDPSAILSIFEAKCEQVGP
jgi:hypothetical protein